MGDPREELLWAMLPEGLEEHFEIEGHEKTAERFRIVLVEPAIVPSDLPEQFRGRRITNSVLKSKTIDDFAIRGRRGELELKRRYWQFEGIEEMYCRPVPWVLEGTRLSKELGSFLKGAY
jgi:hypothetical protein